MIIPLYIRKQNNNHFVFGPGFGTYYKLKDRNLTIKKLLKTGSYKLIYEINKRHRLNKPIYPIIEIPQGVDIYPEWFYDNQDISELVVPFRFSIFNNETINLITFLNLVNEFNLNAQKLRWLKNQNLTGSTDDY